MAAVATNESFEIGFLYFWCVPYFSRQSAGTELSRMIARKCVCQKANPLS